MFLFTVLYLCLILSSAPGDVFVPISVISLFLQLVFFVSFFINLFSFYLFLAALGLCCCARAFSSCGERELLFVAVRGLFIAVASLVAEHGL